MSFSLLSSIPVALSLVLFAEKRREFWTDIHEKTVNMTVDQDTACFNLPGKRHRCLGMKHQMESVITSRELNALKNILFEDMNLSSVLSSYSESLKQF